MRRSRQNRQIEYDDLDEEAYVNEVLYKEGIRSDGQQKRKRAIKKKKKKRKKRRGVLLGFLTFILGIAIIGFAFVLLFHIQKIEVKGNTYSTQDDIVGWIEEDKYAVNSLYVWWKYNHTDVEQLPLVESSKVTLTAPWAVRVTVKEKEISGYIDYEGEYLYFDKEGTVLLISQEEIEGAAYIEGMDVDTSSIKPGQVLPVSDKNVFERIVEVSQLLVKYQLSPDRITCTGSELNLYFGQVEVLLGKTNYENRLAQVPPILDKLKEQFPQEKGTLHLENYDISDKSVRFVPDSGNEEGALEASGDQADTAAEQP
ncbi:cell division protein FtsQ/DivIB [Luxibacter massiliensis]|uniref:cell division protein FtsQ/DivIB n=1 Tax=Luxibacter massiliensis TaxID=2219695 RepID=UPI000F070488|nr:FtsQ-type POTRA domain-containing protein [Luxibacter massiliensis]